MESRKEQEHRYILAKKRVEKIAKFYKHLAAYLLVNTVLSIIFIVGDVNDGASFNEAFTDYHNYKIWLFWGIGIAFQALNVFGLNLFLSKDWEAKKLRQFMDEENRR